jgi:hypothetical protein
METAGWLRVRQREAGGWVLGQNLKPSVCSSVSGVLYETAVGGGDGRWRVRVNGTETAVGLCVR